jgi:predicted aspartyl protease
MVAINEFVLGHLKSDGTYFPVSPITPNADGIFATDYLLNYDADVDFGTDTLNFFSQNHCPGHVVYWQAPAVAELPMKVDNDFHITVSVQIDGQQFDALIDTGATGTTLRSDVAQSKLNLTLGDADTPAAGTLNGVASLVTYRHTFKNLAFGDVAVINPRVTIIPAITPPRVVSGVPRRQLGPLDPEVIIGMDVLRKLHLYMAFKENKLYISPASVSDKPPAPFPTAYMAATIARLTNETVHAAQNPIVWSNRCFWRGAAKIDLDAALADCEQSLKLKSGDSYALYAKGNVLYQQGKYQDAVTSYDAALAAEPNSPDYLFMRGQAKAKLGDAAGSTTDMDAAKTLDSSILSELQRYGLAT